MRIAKANRVHIRTDFEYTIRKAIGYHTGKPMYACIITQSTWSPNYRAVYHVETFHAGALATPTGTSARAAARRYGAAICSGARGVHSYRSTYLPVAFGKLPGNVYAEDKVPLEHVFLSLAHDRADRICKAIEMLNMPHCEARDTLAELYQEIKALRK